MDLWTSFNKTCSRWFVAAWSVVGVNFQDPEFFRELSKHFDLAPQRTSGLYGQMCYATWRMMKNRRNRGFFFRHVQLIDIWQHQNGTLWSGGSCYFTHKRYVYVSKWRYSVVSVCEAFALKKTVGKICGLPARVWGTPILRAIELNDFLPHKNSIPRLASKRWVLCHGSIWMCLKVRTCHIAEDCHVNGDKYVLSATWFGDTCGYPTLWTWVRQSVFFPKDALAPFGGVLQWGYPQIILLTILLGFSMK